MSYEVRKVANGYVVTPARDVNRDYGVFMPTEMFVFETWEDTQQHLREKFETASKDS